MSKRVARLVGAVIVLLSVAFVGGGALGGLLYWDGVELRGEQSARAELGRAEPNKGGHREKAMGLIDQAIAEVRAGIAFAAGR